MAISLFLQQLESELTGKPEALTVVAHYTTLLEQADAQGNKDELFLLQDQLHNALAVVLGATVDPDLPAESSSAMTLDAFRKLVMVAPGLTVPDTSEINNAVGKIIRDYDDSYAVAKEIDPTVKKKPLEEILANIWTLGVPMLREIAQFGKPTLIITPQNAFSEKTAAMNRNKPFRTKPQNPQNNPQDQDDAYVWDDPNSPYTPIGAPSKVSISIVDGATHMPHIPSFRTNSKFDDRRRLFKEHYRNKGLKLINAYEYAMLMQRSLNEYKKSGNDESKIVDYYVSESDPNYNSITCLDDDQYLNKTSPHVAYGCFGSRSRRVSFLANRADNTDANLRGRPSVQVMEY